LDELRDDNGFLRSDDIRLALAALVVQRIRAHIADKTQFRCSAGISHNKMLAKLACGLNKPNAQTLLPRAGVGQLFPRIDISKVRSLGGKLGQNLKQAFGANTMYDLKCLEYQQLAAQYDQKTAKWLTDVANGYDDEPVSNRQLSKSIGCGKNFPGL
jgi:DNA polymerase eta